MYFDIERETQDYRFKEMIVIFIKIINGMLEASDCLTEISKEFDFYCQFCN